MLRYSLKKYLITLLSYFLWNGIRYNVALLPKKYLITLLGYFLWKLMRYNVALLPKKVSNYVTWLLFMESNALQYFCVTFAPLLKYEQGLIVCF